MGLLAKITLYHTNNRKMLFIVDKTGLFDSNTNTGGWDNGSNTSGNPKLTDCANATAVFTFPDGLTKTVSIKDISIPYPNVLDWAFPVTAASCGYDTFPDGLIKVSVFYDGYYSTDPIQFWSAEAASQDFFTANVQCCVQKLFAKSAGNGAVCSEGSNMVAIEAWGKLVALWNAAGNAYRGITGCDQIEWAEQVLEQIDTICKKNNCGCGCN